MEETRFSLLCFKLKVQKNIVFLKTYIPRGVSLVQQGVFFFWLCDQTIEDINFSSAFLVELRGVAQLTWWLNLPHSPLCIMPNCQWLQWDITSLFPFIGSGKTWTLSVYISIWLTIVSLTSVSYYECFSNLLICLVSTCPIWVRARDVMQGEWLEER